MNKYTAAFIAGLTGLAIANTVRLQQTASSASPVLPHFRKATHVAIGNILNPGFVYGYQGADVTKATYAEFVGTTKVGAIPVDIKTSWSGSVGGVATLVKNFTVSTWLAGTNLTAGGTPNETGPFDPAVTADSSMSDSFQGSTAYTSPSLTDTRSRRRTVRVDQEFWGAIVRFQHNGIGRASSPRKRQCSDGDAYWKQRG